MQGVKQTLEDILKAREERVLFQQRLLETFKSPIIAYKLNIPGEVKYNPLIKKIFNAGLKEIKEILKKENIKIIYERTFYKDSGPAYFICFDSSHEVVKKICIGIEEKHPLGRLYDFDVLDKQGMQVSREDIHKQPRRCLLCNNNAFECGRSRAHDLKDLLLKVENMAKDYFKNNK